METVIKYTMAASREFFSQFEGDIPRTASELEEWKVRNRIKILKLANQNIIRVFRNHDGVQTVKVMGYFYDADDGWRLVTFGGYQMPLSEYLSGQDRWDDWESEAKQYIEDLTEDQVINVFIDDYAPVHIALGDLNENTPEGFYIS